MTSFHDNTIKIQYWINKIDWWEIYTDWDFAGSNQQGKQPSVKKKKNALLLELSPFNGLVAEHFQYTCIPTVFKLTPSMYKAM